MANINLQAKKQNSFDAIVIGSGISGGWAAKELCENGLRTLVLEKGRMVKHIKDYPTMNNESWDHVLRGGLSHEDQQNYHVANSVGFVGADNKHFHTNDLDNPYTEVKPFIWIRGHQVGGRSQLWGRQCYVKTLGMMTGPGVFNISCLGLS